MSVLDQDPDYEEIITPDLHRFGNFQRDAQEAAVRKIDDILQSQFEKEIASKETELESIDQHLLESRAMLDHLRACVIAKYYAKVYQIIESDNSVDTASVHPAVKRYIGKTVPLLNENSSEIEGDPQTQIPTALSDPKEHQNEISSAAVESVAGGPRLKSKFCFVVGNVSKFIIPDGRLENNDQATHKWMVYVRGDRENPEIGYLVKKVVFFLHPSYRPNDLVAVMNPPFHLARRGWGEFPVRVQIHFHDVRNKPLDIIHNLKLDKTFTGLQTLGAETVAHVMLLTTPDQFAVLGKVVELQRNAEVKDASKMKNNIIVSERSATMNDVCVKKINLSSPQTVNSKQTRKRSISIDNSSESPKKIALVMNNSCLKSDNNVKQMQTKNKLEGFVTTPTNAKTNGSCTFSRQTSSKPETKNDCFPKERTFQLLLEDGKLLNVKIQPGVVFNSMTTAANKVKVKNHEMPQSSIQKGNLEIVRSKQESFRIESYQTIHQAMFQIVKFFPLRKSHLSWKDFLSWPLGKQRAVDWQRAKKIQCFMLKLLTEGKHPVLSAKDSWTTKTIMLWCRRYGFTPINADSFGRLFCDDDSSELASMCTLSNAQELLTVLQESQNSNNAKNVNEEETFVDVVSLDFSEANVAVKRETGKPVTSVLQKQVVCVEPNSPFVKFVQNVSSQAGIKCVPEEVEQGVIAPMVEMTMATACKEFLYRLLHSALSCRTSNGNVETLTKDDLCRGVLPLPEAEFLTNKYLGILPHQSQT